MALPQVFDASMADGATLSSGIDLGGIYEDVYLKIPTIASASDIYVHGSADNSTFYRITKPVVANTSTVALNDFRVVSTTSQRMVPIPAGFRYMKIELSTLASADIGFEIIAQRKV
jgi:hypothetical protein